MVMDKELIDAYTEKMDAIDHADVECAHAKADDLLISVLKELGLSDVSEPWIGVRDRCRGFWYA